ncbi:hypothetical protein ACLOJK_040108 [Asimina triloba]
MNKGDISGDRAFLPHVVDCRITARQYNVGEDDHLTVNMHSGDALDVEAESSQQHVEVHGINWSQEERNKERKKQKKKIGVEVSAMMLNGYTIVYLIQALSNLSWISYSQQMHSYILKMRLHSNVFVATALLGVYVKWDLHEVHCLFSNEI